MNIIILKKKKANLEVIFATTKMTTQYFKSHHPNNLKSSLATGE